MMCYVAYTLLVVFEKPKRQPANFASGGGGRYLTPPPPYNLGGGRRVLIGHYSPSDTSEEYSAANTAARKLSANSSP